MTKVELVNALAEFKDEDEVFIADGFKEYIYDVESIHYNGIAIMLQADVPKKLKD